MEEINKTAHCLTFEYLIFWFFSVALMLVYELGVLDEGSWIGSARLEFAFETIGILLTLALIPLSLKLFGRRLLKLRDLPLLEALSAYHRLSIWRLFLLALVVWSNLFIYYQTMYSIGGLCALLGCIAALFCIPSKRKLMTELEITA